MDAGRKMLGKPNNSIARVSGGQKHGLSLCRARPELGVKLFYKSHSIFFYATVLETEPTASR